MGMFDWLLGRRRGQPREPSGPELASACPGGQGPSLNSTANDVNLRTTTHLAEDVISLLRRSAGQQALVVSSRGLQLRHLAHRIEREILKGSLAQAEVILITGECPDAWEKDLISVRQQIKDNPGRRRVVLAQGVRPPFDDLFAHLGTQYQATVIRTDLTGYQRLLQTSRMVNSPGRPVGEFCCLVPFEDQEDLMLERDKLAELDNGPGTAEELIRISREIEDFLQDTWPNELAECGRGAPKRAGQWIDEMAGHSSRSVLEGLISNALTASCGKRGTSTGHGEARSANTWATFHVTAMELRCPQPLSQTQA